MNIQLDLAKSTQVFTRFLHRFHVLIFVIVVIGGLSLATFMLNRAITASSSDTATAQGPTTLDQTTIDRLKKLKTKDETATLTYPPNQRTNPFK